MKTQKALVYIVILLIILVAVNFFISLRQPIQQYAPNDNIQVNNAELPIDRVKNQEERERMENYLSDFQQGQQVVKTIVGPSGEMIDCIDLYSQPAIRKHQIARDQVQFAPRTFPDYLAGDSLTQATGYSTENMLLEMTGDTCPAGTIPIQRLTMETLNRFETLDDFFKKGHGYIRPPCGGDGGSPAGHEYAHAYRYVDNLGAEAAFNLWSPYVERSNEFSLAQIWVVRGTGSDLETIEAGWQVYRDLYGDWRSHLFIYFTPDAYGSGGGYNLTTGDFVQTNSTVYIGGGFTNYSAIGGAQYYIKLLIYKDGTDGDWWLRYGDTWVGYWPRSVFDGNGLRDQADQIDFGGEIVNVETDGRHTRTDMGSGRWPYEGYGYAAYTGNIKYVDLSRYYQNATGLTVSVTDNMCYDLDLTESTGGWGVYFYFGGSGYNTYCNGSSS